MKRTLAIQSRNSFCRRHVPAELLLRCEASGEPVIVSNALARGAKGVARISRQAVILVVIMLLAASTRIGAQEIIAAAKRNDAAAVQRLLMDNPNAGNIR